MVEMHRRLVGFLGPQTLAEIDAFIGQRLKAMRSRSCHPLPHSRTVPLPEPFLSVRQRLRRTDPSDERGPLVDGDDLDRHRRPLQRMDRRCRLDVRDPRSLRGGSASDGCRQGVAATRDRGDAARSPAGRLGPGRPDLRRGRVRLQSGPGAAARYQDLHGPVHIERAAHAPGEWPDAERLFNEGLLVAVEPMVNAAPRGGARPRRLADQHRRRIPERALRGRCAGRSRWPEKSGRGPFDLPDVVG